MIRPLQDRVVILRAPEEEVSKGGIYIPDAARERPAKGKVVAVGRGKLVDNRFHALDVEVGETVLFSKYAGTDVQIDGVEHVMLREEDVLGVVE